MNRNDHLSYALEYQRRAIAAEIAGDDAAANASRAKSAFHFRKAGC